jgi:hypothetical protein
MIMGRVTTTLRDEYIPLDRHDCLKRMRHVFDDGAYEDIGGMMVYDTGCAVSTRHFGVWRSLIKCRLCINWSFGISMAYLSTLVFLSPKLIHGI